VLFRELQKKIKVPYTVFIILASATLGYFNKYLGFIGHSYLQISEIIPSIAFLIIMPVICFENAYFIN